MRTLVCARVSVCVCVSAPQAIKNYSHEMKAEYLAKQVLLLISFIIMALAIDTVDGRGLNNDVHHEFLPNGNAVLAIHSTVNGV